MQRRLAALAALAAGAAVARVRAALPPCATDLDCSLNGVCDVASGVCACDAPWVSDVDGESTVGCSFLDMAPSPVSPCGAACVFHGGPSSLDTSWTSWGMSVIAAGGAFHGYVAEMANECDLSAWTRGSQVVHAVASAPTGPFLRGPAGADVVVPAWAHNPRQFAAPASARNAACLRTRMRTGMPRTHTHTHTPHAAHCTPHARTRARVRNPPALAHALRARARVARSPPLAQPAAAARPSYRGHQGA